VNFETPDLCDEFEESVRVSEPLFLDYGGAGSFCGPIATVRCSRITCSSARRWRQRGGGGYWSWTMEDPRGVP
jgi:regulator of RNase E activity RraA